LVEPAAAVRLPAHEHKAWFTALEAPTKRMVTLENAAHAVAFEQFETFDTLLRETILPTTYGGRCGGG
jgi:hypothetical protein